MFFYQQISRENPKLISNICTFLYFWTKGVWTLLIMRINIIPATIYFCFTQDNSTIPCPLDRKIISHNKECSLLSCGKKPSGRTGLQTSIRVGKENLSRIYSIKLKAGTCPRGNTSTCVVGSWRPVIGHGISPVSQQKFGPLNSTVYLDSGIWAQYWQREACHLLNHHLSHPAAKPQIIELEVCAAMLESIGDDATPRSKAGKFHRFQVFCLVVPWHRKHEVYTTDYKIHF